MKEIVKTQIKALLFWIILGLSACHSSSNPIFFEVERVMKLYPDSALSLLETVRNPEKMPIGDYATWCLLMTQARDKNYVEHTSDSVVNVAVRYFANRKDPLRKAQAYYLQGRVLSDLNAFEEALEAYLKAKDNVCQTSDYSLRARICNHLGTLYWRNREDLKSLVYYKDAYWAYKKCRDTMGIVTTLRNIGDSMLALKQQDSAYFYLEEALRFNDLGRLESQKTYILSSLGSLYSEKGNYRKALELNKESLNCSNEESTLPAGYYAVGELYEKLNKPDSALFYVEKALAGTDLYVKCSANHLLYNLAIKNREYDKAFKYNERYLLLRDSIEYRYRPQELLKIESLYNKARLLNKQEQQMHEARSKQSFFVIAFLCLCLICVIIYVVYEKKIREQKLKSQEIRRQLQETRDLLAAQETEIKDKESSLTFVQSQLHENAEKINRYKEKISHLEEGCSTLQNEYEQKLKEANVERSVLSKEKESILSKTTSSINQKNELLKQKDFQISSLYAKKKNSELLVFSFKKAQKKVEQERDNLRRELETSEQKLIKISEELAQLCLQNEQQQLQEQKNTEDIKQKCRMYERWNQMLIMQNKYLSILVKSKNVALFESKEWNLFLENFEGVYPGFVDCLNNRYSMSERELKICCLVKLGLKTGKIAAIFNLGNDTITKLKSEIKEKYFAMSEKQTLDRIIEKMCW